MAQYQSSSVVEGDSSEMNNTGTKSRSHLNLHNMWKFTDYSQFCYYGSSHVCIDLLNSFS